MFDMSAIEEFLKWLFKADDNTVATIIITILVFGIGQLFISISKLLENYNSRSIHRKMFRSLITETARLARKQSKVYFKTAEQFDTSKEIDFATYKAQFFPIKSLDEIGYSES